MQAVLNSPVVSSLIGVFNTAAVAPPQVQDASSTSPRPSTSVQAAPAAGRVKTIRRKLKINQTFRTSTTPSSPRTTTTPLSPTQGQSSLPPQSISQMDVFNQFAQYNERAEIRFTGLIDRVIVSQAETRQAELVTQQLRDAAQDVLKTPQQSLNKRKADSVSVLADDPAAMLKTMSYTRPGTSLPVFAAEPLFDLLKPELVSILRPEHTLSIPPAQILSAVLLEFSSVSISVFLSTPIKSVPHLRQALNRFRDIIKVVYGNLLATAISHMADSIESVAILFPRIPIVAWIQLTNGRLDDMRIKAPLLHPDTDSSNTSQVPSNSFDALAARSDAIIAVLTFTDTSKDVVAQNQLASEMALKALEVAAAANNKPKKVTDTTVLAGGRRGDRRTRLPPPAVVNTPAPLATHAAGAGAGRARPPPIDWTTWPTIYTGEKPCFNWACTRGSCANQALCQQASPRKHEWAPGTTPAVIAQCTAWIRALPGP